ncbi:phosphodiesterase [Anaerosacchariphilus polymeriproducens]|uniref:Phosphoesterase n=1 Tax=Anaerosacchariphilus polymeriproducens TaxID=1812858 RepID=A0A371AVS2_9FIRM|nr:phosphodiesterase [Anaerosacchariphilus polymeriproducens]RDU23632.1 phosphodiesterase [Anaerosacchariphilus polymeriproducens]
MKLMIASDIHGSFYYGRLMIESFWREKADRLILLGDILYHGPRNELPKGYAPKEVITMLNHMKDKILSVRGNCDTEVDQMVLEFPIMADYAVVLLGSYMIYASHGHKYNQKNLPPIQKGDILLNGHTHIPKCVEHENYVYMNPGSISLPKENSCHSYMIMSETSIVWKDLENGIEYLSWKKGDFA